MDLSALSSIDPAMLRATLPTWLASAIDDPEHEAQTVERLTQVVAPFTDEDWRSMVHCLATLGEEHRVYPAHPACRAVSRSWCRSVLLDGPVTGAEHLAEAAARGPTMLVSNHLSYIDANATDALLAWSGHAALADRIVAAAGPKVYETAFRRFASACINTLPVPQSTTLGHTAKLAPRELARRAKASLEAATEALAQGQIVLLFPEGSRSRTGRLQPFLRGVHRWLRAVDDLQVVPLALTGTGATMPVDSAKAVPASVAMRLGPALQVGRDGTSREVLGEAHHAVGRLLPVDLQPMADTSATA